MNHTTRTISLSENTLPLDIFEMKPGTPYLLFCHSGSRKSGCVLESGKLDNPSALRALSTLKVILEQLFYEDGRVVRVRSRARLWFLFKENTPESDEDCWVYLIFSAKQETGLFGHQVLIVSRFAYEDVRTDNSPLTVPRRLKRHVANDSFIRFGIPRFL